MSLNAAYWYRFQLLEFSCEMNTDQVLWIFSAGVFKRQNVTEKNVETPTIKLLSQNTRNPKIIINELYMLVCRFASILYILLALALYCTPTNRNPFITFISTKRGF